MFTVVVVLVMLSAAAAAVGRRNPVLSPEEPLYRCIDAPASSSHFAYALVVGPISEERKYSVWLYPILALRRALLDAGSKADLLVFGAVDECCESVRMLPSEEEKLSSLGVRVRYVPAPAGIRGFHMGHYKLWAWQHTEYARIQLLDADVLPLVNMDPLFRVMSESSDFVGCPGRASVLNAGWFSLRPDCHHFKSLITVLFDRANRPGNSWDEHSGWGVPMPKWRNAEGRIMREGYDFFDAKGNQGHMYAYFRFYANDLTLIYSDRVESFSTDRDSAESGDIKAAATAASLHPHQDENESLLRVITTRESHDRIAHQVYNAFPCPFGLGGATSDLNLAYHHFTGNAKPWTKYDPTNERFSQWYAVMEKIGVDVRQTFFNDTSKLGRQFSRKSKKGRPWYSTNS